MKRVAQNSNLVDDFFWFPLSRATARRLQDDEDGDPSAVDSARFFSEVALKDLQAALAVGAGAGVELPATELAAQLTDRYFRVPGRD